jgi:hypothetical protein
MQSFVATNDGQAKMAQSTSDDSKHAAAAQALASIMQQGVNTAALTIGMMSNAYPPSQQAANQMTSSEMNHFIGATATSAAAAALVQEAAHGTATLAALAPGLVCSAIFTYFSKRESEHNTQSSS